MNIALVRPLITLAFFAFFTVVIGCSDAPPLGKVSGTVTLDGDPVPKAVVAFQPEGAPASRGVTDSNGRYELIYQMDSSGAVFGPHRVIIFLPKNAEFSEMDSSEAAGGPVQRSADVHKGTQVIDFTLSSQ